MTVFTRQERVYFTLTEYLNKEEYSLEERYEIREFLEVLSDEERQDFDYLIITLMVAAELF